MFMRIAARHFGRFIVALGIMLGGVGQASSVPCQFSHSPASTDAPMAMGGTRMQDCPSMPVKHTPANKAPCKCPDGVCPVCAAPIQSATLNQDFSTVALSGGAGQQAIAQDIVPNGITVPPALPPPISLA
jgi:hypothetical protein